MTTERGETIAYEEAVRLARQGAFVWKTADGRYYPLDQIEDDHLLNIELHLLGRSELETPSTYGPGNSLWEETYDRVREEISRRGLDPKV